MTIALDYGVQLLTRSEWGAAEPRAIISLNPIFGSTGHWEGPHMGVFPHESCATKVRGIQAFHMGPSRGWSDIAYTYVVCPHGWAFEGRGRFVRTAANGTTAGNNTAYAVCYLGGEDDGFTEDGKRAMKACMNRLRNSGNAGPARNCHRDWKQTACPGGVICAWIKVGQPLADVPPPPRPPLQEDTDMYLLFHPGSDQRPGGWWQIGPGKVAIEITENGYGRMAKTDVNDVNGLPSFALNADDCDFIINALNDTVPEPEPEPEPAPN